MPHKRNVREIANLRMRRLDAKEILPSRAVRIIIGLTSVETCNFVTKFNTCAGSARDDPLDSTAWKGIFFFIETFSFSGLLSMRSVSDVPEFTSLNETLHALISKSFLHFSTRRLDASRVHSSLI